jgi:hypothetical protein
MSTLACARMCQGNANHGRDRPKNTYDKEPLRHPEPSAVTREVLCHVTCRVLLTLYTTPVVYLYLDRLQTWLKGSNKIQAKEAKEIQAAAAE